MKKIIAFGASNSSSSINQLLAKWASSQLADAETELLNLNDFEMPIFSPEREATGIPEPAKSFKLKIDRSDGVIISLAEYNGNYTTAFKNIIDWVSRIDKKTWSNKPLFLLATSPGGRGGAGVLAIASKNFPHLGGNVVATFSLPTFHQNFDREKGILNEDLKKTFEESLVNFFNAL